MFTFLTHAQKSPKARHNSRSKGKSRRNLRFETLSQRKLLAADIGMPVEHLQHEVPVAEHAFPSDKQDPTDKQRAFTGGTLQPNYFPFNPNGSIIHVDDSSTGTQNGISWPTAFGNLQDGLAAAQPGDWIFVAAGTYSPGATQSDSFWLKTDVDLFGGYEGAFQGTPSSQWYTRDWNEQNKSILSGDINDDDIYPTTTNGMEQPVADIEILNTSDNNYHVVRASRVTNSMMRGFIVQAGHDEVSGGGGLWARDSSIEIADSVFRFNQGKHGGAIHNIESNPYLHEVVFDRNIANEGGGAMANLNVNASPQVTINSVFYKNRADGASEGGAIYDQGNSATVVWNSTFQGNDANTGDSIFSDQSILVVGNSILSFNLSGNGSGISDTGNLLTIAMNNNLPSGWTSSASNQFLSNNLSADTALFLNAPDSALGPDGNWATADDGLCINSNVQGNPFIGHTAIVGSTQLAPQRDILHNLRLPVADIGAYQHLPLTNTRPGPVGGPTDGPVDDPFGASVGPSQYLKLSPTESAQPEVAQRTQTDNAHTKVEAGLASFKTKSTHEDTIAADNHAPDLDTGNADSTVDSEKDKIYADWGVLDHSEFLGDLKMLIHDLASESLEKGQIPPSHQR